MSKSPTSATHPAKTNCSVVPYMAQLPPFLLKVSHRSTA